MGVPMARNLSRAGIGLSVYNRSPKQVDVGGASIVTSIPDAVQTADAVFLMVSDAAATEAVLSGENGVLAALKPGSLIVSMSTIGVDETKQFALMAADKQVEWMDAPVSGSVKPAEEAQLVVLAGGSEAAFKRVEPLFALLAKRAIHLGPVGSGAAMKLLVNAFLGMTMEAVSECLALADKAGLGRRQVLDVLPDTAIWSPALAAKRKMWENNEFPAAFALKHMVKDLRLAADYAGQVSVPMPQLFAALTSYLGAQSHGLADDDMAAVWRHVNDMAGNS